MNNPNPFVPQGSLLEQQSKRRSHFKLGVFCILAISITGLAAMLIQGCKREESDQSVDNGQPPMDTNNYAETDTNPSPTEVSNPPVPPMPPEANNQQTPGSPAPAPAPVPPPAPMPVPPPAPAETEYTVISRDTLSKIAKANGVTVKALEEANPGVEPTRLHVGQKLVIPAGAVTTGGGAAGEMANGVESSNGGEETYTVKSGDTLTRIARHFGVTVKAIEAENNLTSTHIRAGQKLNIPAKPEAAPAPMSVNTPPQAAMPPSAPAPAPAGAPAPDNNPPPAPPANQPTGQ